MTLHISARIAWHMDGWNGRICKDPARNTYCIGQFSYPGDVIAEERDLPWEIGNCGRACSTLDPSSDSLPPCTASINAFGPDTIWGSSEPPEFFGSGDTALWQIPPATVAVWPYEAMYKDEVKPQGTYDNDLRRAEAKEFFKGITENQSLIFYYANYSNPFSEEDQRNYVLVGVSRVKRIGEELLYPDVTPETKRKFADGLVWQRNITSHYPDEGLRLPYHRYLDRPEVLDSFLVIPPNPRNFKYGTRAFSDDEALELIERLIESVGALQEAGDTSEDWSIRRAWLHSLIAELWQSRGLYPGLPGVLAHLGFDATIPFFRAQVAKGAETEARDRIFQFLNSAAPIRELRLDASSTQRIVRQWRLKTDEERHLLQEILPRFDLPGDQVQRVVASDRDSFGIHASLGEIAENPYILSEQFVGDGPDDTISFNKVDRGVFPSPDLGGTALTDPDDWRRLRALTVERLQREQRHTFVAAGQIIQDINHKLAYLPDWKRAEFTERYLEVDERQLLPALVFRKHGDRRYIYLRSVYQAERDIEVQVRSLANRPDISFRSPVTDQHWHGFLYNPHSPLAQSSPDEYDQAIRQQASVCQQIFVRPVCVLSGAAGTGKTTVIKAVIQAAEKAHGTGVTFRLLAPTGKAAERIRSATGRSAQTIHSFLAERGWLNDNMTFRMVGGAREEKINTYIIDEASMVDLDLMAAFFRAVNWATVQRLIFVGDPNQLPPIGRGRVFADTIDWLEANQPESVGHLKVNIRQMENRLSGRGTGILDLASLYIRERQHDQKEGGEDGASEEMLRRIQEGGEVDQDLRVVYWRDAADLETKLVEHVIADLEADTGEQFDSERPERIWLQALEGDDGNKRPEYMQVISPYRGEQFGTENLNRLLQGTLNGKNLQHKGQVGGVTLMDKVIQVRNRPRSNPVWSYNTSMRKNEKIEVFNGEIGFAEPDLRDWKKNARGQVPWLQRWFTVRRLQVVFSRKPDNRIGFDSSRFVEENLELAFAISVHKAQGSEFRRVYFVLPKHKRALLSREMLYTGLTRGTQHCTVFAEEDVLPFISMRRPESSHLTGLNSSLFVFEPVPDAMLQLREWYEEGKIHRTLTKEMVRSKSEVIIANMLFERDIPFRYEVPLFAPDGSFYLPDFTVTWAGETWYWEHLGMMDRDEYRARWERKKAWYERFFPGRLVTTAESGHLSVDANALIEKHFS